MKMAWANMLLSVRLCRMRRFHPMKSNQISSFPLAIRRGCTKFCTPLQYICRILFFMGHLNRKRNQRFWRFCSQKLRSIGSRDFFDPGYSCEICMCHLQMPVNLPSPIDSLLCSLATDWFIVLALFPASCETLIKRGFQYSDCILPLCLENVFGSSRRFVHRRNSFPSESTRRREI